MSASATTSSLPDLRPPGVAPALEEQTREVLRRCCRRLRSWRTPPNWSAPDWAEEIQQVAAIAALQARTSGPLPSDGRLAGFLYDRIVARARDRYREEWAYASRFVTVAAPGRTQAPTDESAAVTAGPSAPVEEMPDFRDLRDALATLPDGQRSLIISLFYQGRTEPQLAARASLSPTAISKRKRAALKALRRSLTL